MVFKRLFKIFQAEAHSVVDQLEDPIKMTEQGIRDLKTDLQAAMTSLAEIKALTLRLDREMTNKKRLAADYERKAMAVLQKMQDGSIDAAEAEGLATQALQRKEDALTEANRVQTDFEAQSKVSNQLQVKVEKLKRAIGKYENELITLRARAKTAQSMKKVNKQLSKVDSSSTLAMLEKMKTKVDEEESLAAAYGELSDIGSDNLDEKLDKAIASPSQEKASDSLLELKKKMGITG